MLMVFVFTGLWSLGVVRVGKVAASEQSIMQSKRC